MNVFGLTVTRSVPAGLSPVYDNRGGWWPVVREAFTGAWQRNIEWTTESVLAHNAVYACITRIAQDIGKLRPKLVEQDGTTEIWQETDNAAHSPVLRKPNRFQNHIQFKEWWAISKLVHGNTYVYLERDARGVVQAMYIMDPHRVKPLVGPDGEVFYNLQRDNLAGLEHDDLAVPASEIIHDRINCIYHPLVGTSPIFACGNAAHMGIEIEKNSGDFFGNSSNPSGILSAVSTIGLDKSRELSEIWNARFSKRGSGGVAVLGDDMKFTPMRMTAVDSQLIQQLGWTAETVCSTFHVPAFKVGVGQQPTYANAEMANQVYYSDCLQSHIEAWELCMDDALGFDTPVGGRMLGVELDLDGLLRMDTATQIDALSKAVGGAIMTPNEARFKMDLEPLTGGDTVYMQQQNFSLEALNERDKSEDPFAKETMKLPPQQPDNPPNSALPAAPSPPDQKALPPARNALAQAIRLRARTIKTHQPDQNYLFMRVLEKLSHPEPISVNLALERPKARTIHYTNVRGESALATVTEE